MPNAQLASISSRLEDIVSADAIAVGFVKSEEDGYELVGAVDAIASNSDKSCSSFCRWPWRSQHSISSPSSS